jgi:hypothetical protein
MKTATAEEHVAEGKFLLGEQRECNDDDYIYNNNNSNNKMCIFM